MIPCCAGVPGAEELWAARDQNPARIRPEGGCPEQRAYQLTGQVP